jgi:hypothetical protein
MKNFVLTPDMLAPVGSAFYPKGHAMLMFETEAKAREAAQALEKSHAVPAEAVQYISPAALLAQISPTVSDADDPLPSAGTDGATVRAFTALARKGHAALLVAMPDDATRDAVMATLEAHKPSMAQRYRMLVIEDL